ncbi:MAG TPA: sulfide/dihydroorotate dehydrogenase-like FAD/NAD-binding protein [Firmicutes bacterium]|jgi:ferredoxin/flavodoxin---NADP+ reductase|nr:sulfide/dihydroorotate dehydrogenase-like FAD/NAD-binding protein [Bacillota bacterium]
MYKIMTKRRLNSVVVLIEVEAPFVARKCEAGQFVVVRADQNGERIPLTIADYNRTENKITLVYQELGYSTKRLSTKNVGDSLQDVAGPLGLPAELENCHKVLGIGGGVGAAPLYPQLKKLAEKGTEVDVILGGRTAELVILENEFRTFSHDLTVVTDDGSYGMKGTVVDALLRLTQTKPYDQVIAIGPLPMMRAVVLQTQKLNIPTMVSLNPIMIDGTGMCGGCRVTVGGKTKFACVDGPDFDGFKVDFDECLRRQAMYKKDERQYEDHHRCLIGLEEK